MPVIITSLEVERIVFNLVKCVDSKLVNQN